MLKTDELRGVGKMGLEYASPSRGQMDREVNPSYYTTDAGVIAGWGAKLVRVPFDADSYLNDSDYRGYVRQWADACLSEGMKVILDCHYPAPLQDIIQSGTSEAEANALVEPMIQALEMATLDFQDTDGVVGVEINEPWPMDNTPDKQHFWMIDMYQRLARRIHALNPDYYIFMDLSNFRWMSEEAIQQGVDMISEPRLVLAFHIYDAEDTDLGFMDQYVMGNNEEAKTGFYEFLNYYYKRIQQLYHLPVVVTEFAGRRDLTQPLVDLMEYMNQEGWGYTYWAYYGGDGNTLLESDWSTLSPTGMVFQSMLEIPEDGGSGDLTAVLLIAAIVAIVLVVSRGRGGRK